MQKTLFCKKKVKRKEVCGSRVTTIAGCPVGFGKLKCRKLKPWFYFSFLFINLILFSYSHSFLWSKSLSLCGRCFFLLPFNFLHSFSHNEWLSLFSHSPSYSFISPPCQQTSSSPTTTTATTIIHNSQFITLKTKTLFSSRFSSLLFYQKPRFFFTLTITFFTFLLQSLFYPTTLPFPILFPLLPHHNSRVFPFFLFFF